MTRTQQAAAWELRRQGLPLTADEAEKVWEAGDFYRLNEPFKLPREVKNLIEQVNWEMQHAVAAAL